MSAKAYPPYRIECKGIDAYIIDDHCNCVIELVELSMHYSLIFKGSKIMQLLCDALNGIEVSKEEK